MTVQANFPSVLPSLLLDFANGKKLDPRVTFTRATTAAYYDDNTTAMAEQNVLLYSQAFANGAWGTTNATKTSTTVTDPAGGSTGLTLTKTSADDYSLRQSGIAPAANTTYTVSAYLKGNAGDTVTFYMDNGTDQSFSSTITLTASWTRYTITNTFNSTAASVTCGVAFRTANTATAVDVAFFQLEQRSSATAYTATTTQAITNYVPVLLTAGGGQPRFDHNPTTRESLGLLIEEQRTNIVTYSAQFDNGSWGKDGGISVTANQAVAPDGTIAMDLMTRVPGSLSSWAALTNAVSVGTGGNVGKTYSFSVWVQALPTAGSVNGSLAISDVSYNTYTSSFIATTTPTRVSITTSGGSGWNANGAYIGGGINLDSNNTSVLVWGAQLEVGAFPTSYIPTTSAAATRAADAAVMTGNNLTSWFNNSEGTLYGEASFPSTASGGGASKGVANLGNTVGPTQNSMALYYSPTLNQSTFEIVSGSVQATFNAAFYNKLAGAYKFNDSNLGYGGSVGTTDTACTIPVCDQFVIGNVYSSTQPYATNGWIKKISYYPVRVTNAQLQALSS